MGKAIEKPENLEPTGELTQDGQAKPCATRARAKPKRRKGKKRGPPPFKPTAEQRGAVRALVACGRTHEQICAYLGLGSTHTLERRFRQELAEGLDQLVMGVYARMAKIAMGQDANADARAVIDAGKYLLDRRGGAGFQPPTQKTELTGKDGGPIRQDINDARTPADARRVMQELFGSVGPQESPDEQTSSNEK